MAAVEKNLRVAGNGLHNQGSEKPQCKYAINALFTPNENEHESQSYFVWKRLWVKPKFPNQIAETCPLTLYKSEAKVKTISHGNIFCTHFQEKFASAWSQELLTIYLYPSQRDVA